MRYIKAFKLYLKACQIIAFGLKSKKIQCSPLKHTVKRTRIIVTHYALKELLLTFLIFWAKKVNKEEKKYERLLILLLLLV